MARRRSLFRVHLLLTVAALGACVQRAGAQDTVGAPIAQLEGRVIDTTDARVSDARVELVGAGDVLTDANGVYRFRGVPSGMYFLRVQRLGYMPVMKTLSLRERETLRVDVELTPAAPQLDRVVVTAARGANAASDPTGFGRRQSQHVGGVFISAEEIAHRGATQTEQLFRTVPFVRVSDGGVLTISGPTSSSGSPIPRGMRATPSNQCTTMQVFVDGARVGDGFDVNTVPPASIKGIEVYRGPATTPPELRSFGTICGTVAIWTK